MKRFTETDKWRDPWFRGLSLEAKLVFWYLTENCDGAGVWDPDYEIVNFTFKRDIDWDSVKTELSVGGRLVFLQNGRWHLTKFIGFQYGQLTEECPPHRHVLRLVEKHGLSHNKLQPNPSERVVKPFQKTKETPQEKEKDKEREKAPRPPDPIFEALCQIQGSDFHALTSSERGKVNAAEKQIRGAMPAVTAEEITRRAVKLRSLWPSVKVTAPSLAAHWSECSANGGAPPRQAPLVFPEPEDWKDRLSSMFPQSRYGRGGPDEAQAWAELPTSLQQQLTG